VLVFNHLELRVSAIVVLEAIGIEAGHALSFICETSARMTTLVDFVAACLHELDAALCSANILESFLVTDRRLL